MNKTELLTEINNIFYLSNDPKKSVFWKTLELKYFANAKAMDKHNNTLANKIAGTLCADGYRRIKWKGLRYASHHIAFALQNGRWPKPEEEIDHANRVRDDNSHLIATSKSENLENRGGKFDIPRKTLNRMNRLKALNDAIEHETAINGLESDPDLDGPVINPLWDFNGPHKSMMVEIEKIKIFGPDNEPLSIRPRYLAIDRELFCAETENEGFQYFDELELVQVQGEEDFYLADGVMRLNAYVSAGRFSEVPCRVHFITTYQHVTEACRTIGAEKNTRPRVKIEQEVMREQFYQTMWQNAKIDTKNKTVEWGFNVKKLAESYRINKNTPTLIKKVIRHLVQNEIEQMSFKSDKILFLNRQTIRDEEQKKSEAERIEMEVEVLKKLNELMKSNSFCEVMSDTTARARVLEFLAGGERQFKEAVNERFSFKHEPITKPIEKPKMMEAIVKNEFVEKIEWD